MAILQPALVLLIAAAGSQGVLSRPPRLEFPEGPMARAWASVGPEVRPAVQRPLPAAGADRWRAWADALEREREAHSPDSGRRALLARLALAQGRHQDAWRHASACLAQPELLAGLVPSLLPGVEPVAWEAGALPDGALLRPALPPYEEPFLGSRKAMSIDGLRVGDALVAMSVSVDPDGVQVELAHLDGGPARVRVALPEPGEFAIRVVYVDWFRQDEVGSPLEVELLPGEEPRVLFGRFAPRDAPWTRELPPELPAGLVRDGLRLELGELDEEVRSELAGLGPALAAVLGARVATVAGPTGAAETPFAGIAVELEPETWRRELAAILSSVERYTLRSAPAGR